MKIKILILLMLCLPGLVWADDNDQNLARKLTMSGEIVPLNKVIDRTIKDSGGNLLEAELESENGAYVYGLQVLMPDGVVWEYTYNARNGELIKKKKEH